MSPANLMLNHTPCVHCCTDAALSLELEQTRGTCERLAAILRQAQRDNEKQTVVLSNKLNLDADPRYKYHCNRGPFTSHNEMLSC